MKTLNRNHLTVAIGALASFATFNSLPTWADQNPPPGIVPGIAGTINPGTTTSPGVVSITGPGIGNVSVSSILIPGVEGVALGHGEGNGGDAYTQEFTTIARQVATFLVSRPAGAQPSIDITGFQNVIDTVNLYSIDQILLLDGVPKDLENFPRDNAIVISRPRWNSIIDTQKYSIVTHEIFGIMGMDDRRYEISGQLLAQSQLTASSFTPNNPADSQKFSEWCSDSAGALQRALTSGYQASTADQEKTILLDGIKYATGSGSTKFSKFFTATLNAALADMMIYSDDTSRQVYLLRTYVQFAIEDLSSFTGSQDPNNNGPYLVRMLKRAISFGLLSKTNVEELDLLARAAQRGVLLIDSSDYQRTGGYACTRRTLGEALAISSDDSLTAQSQVLLLRQVLTSAAQLQTNCN
jgi:hypothetical protein